ncbi:S49 family peptidase [endosymbiont of unidentified scaly snail isolate Monju]|uniref:S49 family peptidase n=1 Tax=endosymbiont of unidentified scaly snail isolate Monju TaxID=1248727 RepID=UPI00038928A0|nr:S49 family peptidase [endosymbiont of unidentified scaly snail isolate Monju]BAN69062.1 protease IV [endosymbiont of unidentified scaly snail isolate Monju]
MNEKEEHQVADAGWERELVENLATEALREKRRARRWGIFFKLLTFLYLGVILYLLNSGGDINLDQASGRDHVALVELEGVIGPDGPASADQVNKGLRKAFRDSHTKAVVLRINSPGGTPVQASLIYDEIRRLRKKHEDIPLYVVVGDMCASGGYFVAAAADKIFVNRSSIVGSIGVLMDGFGFTGALDKLGVERRLLTAGEHKGMLDPFSPLEPFDEAHARKMLSEIHAHFIEAVKEGRGDRLADDDTLFSGLFWTGQRAIDLGLADELGDLGHVARDVVGIEKVVDFTAKDDPLQRLADRIGVAGAEALAKLAGWWPGIR